VVARRAQLLPWQVAGQLTDRQQSADDVVQATGWVFNSDTGDKQTLAEFVASGDAEVAMYLDAFGLAGTDAGTDAGVLVEIGAGIGRMTCAFTRRFRVVYACDLDSGFLERCREAVARFGRVDRLRTIHVGDGRTLEVPDEVADLTFSYITLQHCSRRDAKALVDESLRVLRPGGTIALNFRQRVWADVVLLPLGKAVRAVFTVKGLGPWLSRHRSVTRVAWQVNRLDPHQVLDPIRDRVGDVVIWRNPRRATPIWGAAGAQLRYFESINPAHWWLVASRR
jgi:ubiquinone/menaquinone biosynthesis C-methylase UbiE